MIQIDCQDLAKQFQGQAIIKEFSFCFQQGKAYSISGPNGSGKSTLMGLLSGWLSPSSGQVLWSSKETGITRQLTREQIAFYLNWLGPYTLLPDEVEVGAFLKHHEGLDKLQISRHDLLEDLQLQEATEKPIRSLSTGMQQRLKLGIMMYSTRPILLLDEPLSNLDAYWSDWLMDALHYCQDKLLIVAGNLPKERAMGSIPVELEIVQQ